MMKSPNVERLGNALSHVIRNATGNSRELLERNYSPLVRLQSGRHGTPLFLVPGAGANVTSFIELADRLNRMWQFTGFNHAG